MGRRAKTAPTSLGLLGPGIRRVRRGRGFSYEDEHGRRIDDHEQVERIRDLAIPPAWEDVWVCSDPFGHLQATGVEIGMFRVGSEQYADEDSGIGLATIRREHVRIEDDAVAFDYPCKGGSHRHLVIEDPMSIELVRTLKRRRSGSPKIASGEGVERAVVDLLDENTESPALEPLAA